MTHTKSVIQQELEKYERDGWSGDASALSVDDALKAIQKALEEFNRQVEAKIEEVSNKLRDDDKAYNYNAGLMKAQVIAEKCFEVKDGNK